ncbi:Macrolide+export+protein+MacA [Methylocapsa aurea]|uniref:efflux RND transporter periplasmic adaptor subunit n=1 Tax=Methylocapsa aurea TaxID=663610 RepID=UPI003D18E6E4
MEKRDAVPTGALRRWGWLVPACVTASAVAAGAAALYWTLSRDANVHYLTQKITHGPVVRAVTASGTVNPVITVQVGTYVSGVIQARYCDYNTKVEKGRLCAKIDPRPYQIVVDQDRASLAVARAQLVKDRASLAYAKASYERNQRLVQTKAVSQDALDSARSAYEQALAQIGLDEATIDQRQAELNAAQINLGYTDIVSPVDGTVVSRSVEMGQTVAASFQTPTLFLVATDLTAMQVDTNVSESDIGAVRLGQRASFTVESFPNRPFDGEVTQVRQSPQTIQNVVTYDAVISVPNPDLLLKPGMTATARVIIDKRDDALRAPNAALRYTPGGLPTIGPLVAAPDGSGAVRLFVLREGSPQAVFFTQGLDDDAYTEIVKGDLRPGDEVIVGEQQKQRRS